MKIMRLDLGRFRHFQGRTLDFAARPVESTSPTLSLFPDGPGRLCLVHGENEAGKSTVLEAVKCLLFGFPDRAAHLAIDVEQSALEVSARKFEHRPVHVGVCVGRLQQDRLVVVFDGAHFFLLQRKCMSAIVVGFGVVGAQADRPGVIYNG